jgi:hypothetical protein
MPAARYLFAMPDTYIPLETFYRRLSTDFCLGAFRTDSPERFGVIHNGRIVDKPTQLSGTKQWAWGALSWSRKVATMWLAERDQMQTHTDAFNKAIDKFGAQGFKLDYFYDLASWPDYLALVTEVLPIYGSQT